MKRLVGDTPSHPIPPTQPHGRGHPVSPQQQPARCPLPTAPTARNSSIPTNPRAAQPRSPLPAATVLRGGAQLWGPPQSQNGAVPCACHAPRGPARGCWRRGLRWRAWCRGGGTGGGAWHREGPRCHHHHRRRCAPAPRRAPGGVSQPPCGSLWDAMGWGEGGAAAPSPPPRPRAWQ